MIFELQRRRGDTDYTAALERWKTTVILQARTLVIQNSANPAAQEEDPITVSRMTDSDDGLEARGLEHLQRCWTAASLVLDQAEVDDTLDFEHSSDEDSEERLRQQAESVPLRPKDHVDHLDEVITRWLTFETEKLLQQPPTPAPPSQSTDSRNSPAPIAASDVPPPSVPQVVVDFLLDKITSDLPPSTSPAARAWNLLHSYMTDEKPPSGDEVKTSLDELQVEKMKPAEQVVAEQEVNPKVNTSLEPLLLDDEDDPTSEERDELEGLATLVAHRCHVGRL
ncbi:hypothetical protein BT96DRAFT_937179 [Gymnopus androsaceus JB14]|uniref:Uncharacterized protein n=1 Tax=Gymnopus androsaceus JB14 TaxID=1447944 RepID=A0A6A4I0R1_9AGAR|nr:hypothetical protein BT96DRAFT_937179 [Gymnopus androsaceus JB14]